MTPPRSRWGWGGANLALAALGLNVVILAALSVTVFLVDIVPDAAAQPMADLSSRLAGLSGVARWVGALGFLPWLSHAYRRALVVVQSYALQEEHRKGPVVGFFIPFLNFVRPYRAVKVLDESLEPSAIPLPPPQLEPGTGTYREPARLEIPTMRATPHAPVGVWWGLWIASTFTSMYSRIDKHPSNFLIGAFDLVPFAAAVACCLVILRVTARLEEVERRTALAADAPPFAAPPPP